MTTVDERDAKKTQGADPVASPAAAPVPEAQGPGTQRLTALISRGGRPPEAAVAELLQQNPAERTPMLALLNHTLGNSYVQGVLTAKPAAPDPMQQATAILAAQVKEPPAAAAASAKPAAVAKPSLLHRIGDAIKTSTEGVVHEASALAGGTEKLAVSVGQHLEVAGAEAVGVAELAGLKYPVKSYEAQVDGGLYRGSRLDDAGMASLKQQGVQGVISLCLEHTDDAALAAKYGLPSLNVKILDNSAPTVAQMNEFIGFARAHAPAYVHCEAGKGRTGVAVACYRVAVDGWTADQAIAEGRGYGLTLINQIAFIRHYAQVVNGGAVAAPAAPGGAAATAAPTDS